jgi:hypothetical protein
MSARFRSAFLLCAPLIVFLYSPALAQPIDVARWFGPDVGNRPYLARYALHIYPDADVQGQDTDLGLLEHNFFFLAPVWQNENHELGISAKVELQDADTAALLPKENIQLPGELWEVRVGANYRGVVRGDWIWGLNASLGSASNLPFQAGDAFDGTLGGILRIPHKERNAWLFFLYFATNREFLNYIPLPGAGYWWEPSDKFRAVVGVPFVSWAYHPTDRLSMDFSYFPARNIQTRASYKVYDPMTLFVRFDWRNQRYFRADRDDNDERIFYYEKRVGGGFLVPIPGQISLTFEGGWAFDRFYFEGEDYGDRDRNLIDVDSSPYAAVKIAGRF